MTKDEFTSKLTKVNQIINELIYALMQTGMTYRQAEEEVFRMLKGTRSSKETKDGLKAALLRKGVSFPFDTHSLYDISGYWGNGQPFRKSLWHPKQQTNLSQVSFFFLDLALLPSLA
jgi:hypothetical protein